MQTHHKPPPNTFSSSRDSKNRWSNKQLSNLCACFKTLKVFRDRVRVKISPRDLRSSRSNILRCQGRWRWKHHTPYLWYRDSWRQPLDMPHQLGLIYSTAPATSAIACINHAGPVEPSSWVSPLLWIEALRPRPSLLRPSHESVRDPGLFPSSCQVQYRAQTTNPHREVAEVQADQIEKDRSQDR